jgi:hypothetical protein
MIKPLSKNMLDALLALHRAPEALKLDRSTIKALVSRGLIDTNSNITLLGSIKAIERLSLREQCQSISIGLSTSQWDSASTPEMYCYNTFVQRGHIGSYCEGGGFGAAIKALCLDALTEASIFYGTCIDAREDACLKGVVGLAHIEASKLETIFKQIQQTTKAKYLASFSEIISYNLIREWYPGLSLEFADALFNAVPKEHFEQLARWVSKDPSHRNGWPDLTLVKGGRLKFVEVKTTDRLHHSQLVTIPALVREIGADVSVLQLVSANNSFKPKPLRGSA